MWPSYLGVPAFHGSDKSMLSVDRCKPFLVHFFSVSTLMILTSVATSVLWPKCSRLVIDKEMVNVMYISRVNIDTCTSRLSSSSKLMRLVIIIMSYSHLLFVCLDTVGA